MDGHQNARTTPHSRAEIVRRVTEGRQPVRVVAEAFGISPRTVRKWLARSHQAAISPRGWPIAPCRPAPVAPRDAGGRDRPDRRPAAGPLDGGPDRPGRGTESGHGGSMGPVAPRGSGAPAPLARREPVRRYKRARPGELLHMDIKKLGRISGVGHRITGDPTAPRPRHRLGVRARGDRRL